MGDLLSSYYDHMIGKEIEAGPELDTFGETKAFFEKQFELAGIQGNVSDQAVSNFIAKTLPEKQASGGEVFMNFFAQAPHMIVEGVQKFLGEAGTVASILGDELLGETPTPETPLVYDPKKGNLMEQASAAYKFKTPEGKGVHDFAIDMVKTAHSDQAHLIPDGSREKATEPAGRFAWELGELLLGDAAPLALLHKPSSGFATALEKPIVSWAGTKFASTSEKMSQTVVGAFTKKALANVTHEALYGMPQTLGLTLTNKGNFIAIDKMVTSEDPLERQKAKSYVLERLGEDQAFNMVASMAFGTFAPLVGAGFKKFSASVKTILPPIKHVHETGEVPPLPASDLVRGKLEEISKIDDPVLAAQLTKQVEFLHAEEIDTYLGEWITKVDEVVSDNFGLSRDTGSILKGWTAELDNKIQTLGNLLEDGSPIAEPHIVAMEKLAQRASQLEDLYQNKGFKRLDDILTGDPAALDAEGKLLKDIFTAFDRERGSKVPSLEPDLLTYFRTLHAKTALTFTSLSGTPATALSKIGSFAKTFLDSVVPADVKKTPAAHLESLVDLFFDPVAPINRTPLLQELYKAGTPLDNSIFSSLDNLKAGIKQELEGLRQAGKLDVDVLHNNFSTFFDIGDAADTTRVFKISTTGSKQKIVLNPQVGNSKFAPEVAGEALSTMRKVVDSFFNGKTPPSVTASVDILDALYGRAKQTWQEKFLPSGFDSLSSSQGYVRPGIHLKLTDQADVLTSLHEVTHMFERFLSDDTKDALYAFIRHKTSGNWVMPDVNSAGVLKEVNLAAVKDPGYWKSTGENLARYVSMVLQGDLAATARNPLQLPKESLLELRRSGEVLKHFSDAYLGDKTHSLVAREFFGLFLDDLERTALVAERKLEGLGKEFQETIKEKLPKMVEETTNDVLHSFSLDTLPGAGPKTSISALREALLKIDQDLKITHDHKSMTSLIDRFFTLKDTFQHYINRPELRAFYDDVVFRGNKKILSDLHEGFNSVDKIVSVISSADDKVKLSSEYETFKNFVTTAEGILSGAYQHSPSVWTSHTSLGYRKGLVSHGRDLLRKLPYFKDREGLSRDLLKLDRLTSQAEFLTKKFPALKPVYGAVERFMEDSQSWFTKALEGSLKGLNRHIEFLPIEHYMKLEEGSKILKAVDELLLTGNDAGNELAAWPKEEAIPESYVLDGLGMLNKQIYRGKFKQLSDSEYELVWGIYGGVREMLNHVSKDMRGLFARHSKGDAAGLTLLDKKFGKIRGYIPQTRKGKYFFESSVPGEKGKQAEKTVIFSDDIKALRLLEEKEKALGKETKLGMVTKRMDTGHFAPSLASLEKILQSVGEKASLDEDVMKLIRAETTSLIKSDSYLAKTLKRRNVEGWDRTRVRESVYDYVQGYSRFRHRHDAMTEALDGLKYLNSSKYAEAWKWGQDLIFDMTKTQDHFKALDFASKAVYWKFLAGNLSSAALQLTQIPTMSLSRMVLEGLPRSGRLLTGAVKDIISGGKKLPHFERRALEEGYALGVTYANFVQELGHNVRRSTAIGKKAQMVFDLSMEPMRIMEEFNRKTTLLAAYRGVREQLLSDLPDGLKANKETVHKMALERAITIVKDSQLTYSKMNNPSIIRGDSAVSQLGRQAYILKQFTHGYGQLFGYMLRNGAEGEKAALTSLAALATIGGAAAIPGFSLISPLLEKMTGEDAYEHLEKLGTPGKLLAHGGSSFLPTKLGRRLNPIPANLSEIALPPGMSLLEGLEGAKEHYQKGDLVRLLFDMPFVPNSAANVVKAVDQRTVGRTTESGKVIPGTKAPLDETISQFVSFSPWNEQYVKYQRGKRKERLGIERRTKLFALIRNEASHGGISPETRKAFYSEQIMMLKDGKRMTYKRPEDVVNSN